MIPIQLPYKIIRGIHSLDELKVAYIEKNIQRRNYNEI